MGKRLKSAAAAAALEATRARRAPTLAPSLGRAPINWGTVETVGSPLGGGVGPRQEVDTVPAPLLPLSALSDPVGLLGPPPRDVDGGGNSAQKKVYYTPYIYVVSVVPHI